MFGFAAYQDALTWARQLGSGATFIDRINRPGSSNADMRAFVQTLRRRLEEAGAPHDADTVWRLLGRLQILVFDFTAPGSADETLARERAAQTLLPGDTSRAGELWTVLVELALRGRQRWRPESRSPDRGPPRQAVPSDCPSRVGASMLGRRVGKGEAHKSATVDDKMKISQGSATAQIRATGTAAAAWALNLDG